MKIHEIIEGTELNGPGFRLGVWFRGCDRGCKGCFNTDACCFAGGTEMSAEQIAGYLSGRNYDGISLSGGEPFLQPKGLQELLEICKRRGINTLVFTGFTFEELRTRNPDILKLCDYLIDGPYVEGLKSRCRFTGSGNQRFLRLSDGEIEEDLTENDKYAATDYEESEIVIEDGQIKNTGFFDLIDKF